MTIGSHADEDEPVAARAELGAPSRALHRPADRAASRHPTVIQWKSGTASSGPAAVRLLPRRGAARAGRPVPGRVRRGRDGRQLVAQRRRQGHLGDRLSGSVSRGRRTARARDGCGPGSPAGAHVRSQAPGVRRTAVRRTWPVNLIGTSVSRRPHTNRLGGASPGNRVHRPRGPRGGSR